MQLVCGLGGPRQNGCAMESATDNPNRASSTYTIQSHGAKLARFLLYDWIILLILAVIEGLLQYLPPFQRFVSKRMMDDLHFPFSAHNTVPFWSVPLYSVLLPIIIFTIFYFRRRNVYDLHNATLGLLYAVAITAVVTDSVKNAVGRPRPNFFWRCFPDGKEKYDSLGNAVCHGVVKVIREGHRSFPSGHSSMSFAGLGFLSLYLYGKMRVFDHKGHVAKICIASSPLLLAIFVAISRVRDYWHHWQDVVVGGLLGLVVAYFSYHQFFPSPNHPNGREPYACLVAMENKINGKEQEEANNIADHPVQGSNDSSTKSIDDEARNRSQQTARDSNDSQIRNRRRHEIGDVDDIEEDDLEAQR